MAETRTDIRAFGRLAAREIDHTELEQVSGGTCDPAWMTSTSTWHPEPIGDDKDDDCGGGGGGGGGGGTDTDDSDPMAIIVVLT